MSNSKTLANVLIGNNIRKERKRKSLSLNDVASACNMEKTNLSRIELGKTNVTVNSLVKIAEVLEVPLSCFFSGL